MLEILGENALHETKRLGDIANRQGIKEHHIVDLERSHSSKMCMDQEESLLTMMALKEILKVNEK